jgi:hypothetical protein
MGPPSEPCMRTAARTRPDHSQKGLAVSAPPACAQLRIWAPIGSRRREPCVAARTAIVTDSTFKASRRNAHPACLTTSPSALLY